MCAFACLVVCVVREGGSEIVRVWDGMGCWDLIVIGDLGLGGS